MKKNQRKNQLGPFYLKTLRSLKQRERTDAKNTDKKKRFKKNV